MKRILTAILAFMLVAGAANAQTKEQGQKSKMDQELGLSAEQKAEMKRIHEAEKNEIEAVKNNDKLTKEEAMAARKAIHEKYREQFRSVLTEEQQKKADEMKAKKGKEKEMKHEDKSRDHEKIKDHDKAHAPKNGMAKHRSPEADGKDRAKMEEELNLTEDQKAKFAKSREEFRAKAETIRNDGSLSKEEKQKALRTLAEKQREDLKSILTAEQLQKMESKRKESKNK